MKDIINKVIAQDEISKLSQSELLTFSKQFEGAGRSKNFSEKAATREKRKKGENFEYDFSWSWLTNHAAQKAIEYGSDQKWHIREFEGEKKIDVIIINRKETKTKKRTVEASEQVWKLWDETLEGFHCKAAFMTMTMERFIHDIQAGKVEVKFGL